MKNLSLNKKISMILAAFVFGLIVVSVLGVRNLGSINSSLEVIADQNTPRIINSNSARAQFRNNAIFLLNVLVEEDREERAKLVKNLEKVSADYLLFLNKAISESSTFARPKYEQVRALYSKWQEVSENAIGAKNNSQPFMEIYQDNKRLRAEAEVLMAEMVDYNIQNMNESKADAGRLYVTSRNTMISVSILITLFSSGLAFVVLSMTSRRINNVITSLKEGSAQVSTAAQQIASSSEELSQSSTEQAASLEQTAASIEEMNSMIAKNSENASAAASTSVQSQHVVTEGKKIVEKMIGSMEAINQNSERMSEIINVIENIGAKTKVINDIVFQTKLLSFNASVEAARAGEHGQGFAVVAEEVGNLAQMSGNAAQEIGSLLEESTKKVHQIIQETKANVGAGSKIAQDCGEAFDSVVENVEKVSRMAAEISSASEEQARGCAEVSKAMTHVDQATQQNSATSEECASASEELAAQAEILESTVSELVSTVLGASAAVNDRASTQTFQNKSATKKVSGNVVPVKFAKPKTEHVSMRKASGVPDFNNPGFEDV